MLNVNGKDLIETPWEGLDEPEREAVLAYAKAIAKNETVTIPRPWLKTREDPRRLAFCEAHVAAVIASLCSVRRDVQILADCEADHQRVGAPSVAARHAQQHVMRLQEALQGIDRVT